MQDPLKVTLPPWRRGDGGQVCVAGMYAIKLGKDSMFIKYKAFDEKFSKHYDYAGPIEFIETPPEPEPLTLPQSYNVTVGKRANGVWQCEQWADGGLIQRITADTKSKCIEANNAAVRAMEESK